MKASSPGPPLRFAFGVHLHQPVGNFDRVIEEHVRRVYLPFLTRLAERDFLPIAVHLSGPLLEWLEAHDTALLDLIGSLAASGHAELLLAGMYEPILVGIPRADRLEQIEWMRERIRDRFGVEARGLWLTERVWDPSLVEDLTRAGVAFALVDDRHFLVNGFERAALDRPFWTESDGRRLGLFAIDERLRYLIPFRAPRDIVRYLRRLRQNGRSLAVLADDGEKFGGWPGTRKRVYGSGWLDRFLRAMARLLERGELELTTFAAALETLPGGGLAYLPTASYREMEEWALPPTASARLAALREELGEERSAGPDGALVRGGHWLNFLVKYPEANRMHKKMTALSRLSRQRGDPPEARRAIGRAQCNDAYWHGVFGGLYLPHLRAAVWRQLAIGERILRQDEPPGYEWLDIDADGHTEIWLHSNRFSAIISPYRGAAIEEYTLFDDGANLADVLTRRIEAYHRRAVERRTARAPAETGGRTGKSRRRAGGARGGLSIHHIERRATLAELPPRDPEPRALLVERFLAAELEPDPYAAGDYAPIRSLATVAWGCDVRLAGNGIEVVCRTTSGGAVEKCLRFGHRGELSATYWWEPGTLPANSIFAPELSVARAVFVRCSPDAELWRYPIETVTRSERGLETTVQGESITPRWASTVGDAAVEIELASRDAAPGPSS